MKKTKKKKRDVQNYEETDIDRKTAKEKDTKWERERERERERDISANTIWDRIPYIYSIIQKI